MKLWAEPKLVQILGRIGPEDYNKAQTRVRSLVSTRRLRASYNARHVQPAAGMEGVCKVFYLCQHLVGPLVCCPSDAMTVGAG